MMANKALVYGDLFFSVLHGRLVRFVRWDGQFAVAMDRDSGRELPDLIHPTHMR